MLNSSNINKNYREMTEEADSQTAIFKFFVIEYRQMTNNIQEKTLIL